MIWHITFRMRAFIRNRSRKQTDLAVPEMSGKRKLHYLHVWKTVWWPEDAGLDVSSKTSRTLNALNYPKAFCMRQSETWLPTIGSWESTVHTDVYELFYAILWRFRRVYLEPESFPYRRVIKVTGDDFTWYYMTRHANTMFEIIWTV